MQNLQNINFKMYAPKAPLDKYVQAIWLAKKIDNIEVQPFKILSDCAASVVFNFAGSLELNRGSECTRVDNQGVIIGPGKDLLTKTFNGPINAIGIHFLASGGHVFFSQTMDTLANQFVGNAANSFLGGLALSKQLTHLSENTHPKILIDIVESHLVSELSQYEGQAQQRLSHLLHLVENGADFSLQDLANSLDVSIREVQRIFKQFVGVAPNVFLRVNKINQIKGKVANNDFTTLTELAIESGYFDQAHFTREFKLFMQATPKQYQKIKMM